MTVCRFQRWTKQAVRHADRRMFYRNNVTARHIVESFVEIETVIVGNFPLEHDVAVNAISEPCADSEIICIRLRDIEGVEKDAGFHAGLAKAGRREQYDKQEEP